MITELNTILRDFPLVLSLAIIIGIILIIIALATQSFKPQKVPLSMKQSRALAAIGIFLILSGVFGIGIFQSENTPPLIQGLIVDPPLATVSEGGITPVHITVLEGRNNNIFIRIFGEPTPLYEFSFSGPSTNYSSKNIQGPSPITTCVWNVTPSEIGKNILEINLIYGLPSGRNVSTVVSQSYSVILSNQKPIIEKLYLYPYKDIYPINERIQIKVKAADPENDLLYYTFFRLPPKAQSFLEIPPLSNYRENVRYWAPNKNDIGENIIRAEVRDGDPKGPYFDSKGTSKELKIDIYDPRSVSPGEHP